jgi:hypothetical protein
LSGNDEKATKQITPSEKRSLSGIGRLRPQDSGGNSGGQGEGQESGPSTSDKK